MYLIVGLGNPEEKYGGTRHNMGFNVINKLANKYKIEVDKNKFDGLYAKMDIENEEVILLKPQTYMNLSGISVKKVMDFYKITIDKLIIVYDDIDVEPGHIKIRKKGTDGGHNGIKSVIQELGTQEFMRIRVGIGKPLYKDDLINYVIGKKISNEEQEKLDKGIELGEKAVIEILKNGIDIAMNRFN